VPPFWSTLTDAKFTRSCTSFEQANGDFREEVASANAGGLMVVVENYPYISEFPERFPKSRIIPEVLRKKT
jgi:hypothetical protein